MVVKVLLGTKIEQQVTDGMASFLDWKKKESF